MTQSFLDSILGKKDNDPFIAVDIGSSAIKIMSIAKNGEKYKLEAAALSASPASAISNNSVSKTDQVAQVIREMLQVNEIRGTRAVVVVPGTAAFTKKISIPYTDLKTLTNNIKYEAGNYIPHSSEAVHLDFQVLKAHGTTSLDVLLVAVKNEIINTYITAVEKAGLEPVIADVDYFALENMFELSYPEENNKTLAVLNIGARYSSVLIMQDGETLFQGDVGVGGRMYTDALCESLGMTQAEAEKARAGISIAGFDSSLITETLDRTTEHVASELHRQLGFFWNAAATDRSIETIYICGGACTSSGLLEELGVKTGLPCMIIDPLRGINYSEGFDSDYISEIRNSMSISVGLAVRRFGDKQHMMQ